MVEPVVGLTRRWPDLVGRASLEKGEVEEEEKVGDDNKARMLQKEKKMGKRTRLRELGPVDSPVMLRLVPLNPIVR